MQIHVVKSIMYIIGFHLSDTKQTVTGPDFTSCINVRHVLAIGKKLPQYRVYFDSYIRILDLRVQIGTFVRLFSSNTTL